MDRSTGDPPSKKRLPPVQKTGGNHYTTSSDQPSWNGPRQTGLVKCANEDKNRAYRSYGNLCGCWRLDGYDGAYRDHHITVARDFLKPFDANATVYMQCRTEYFRLYIDLDLKEGDDKFAPILRDPKSAIELVVEQIDRTLSELCENVSTGYIFTDKPMKVSGIHLYFPGIVVNGDFARSMQQRLLEHLVAESEITREVWEKVVDRSVYGSSMGLRMPYCRKSASDYYRVVRKKSTYPVTSDSKERHLALTDYRTDATDFNFTPKLDEDGVPLWHRFRPPPPIKKQRMSKKLIKRGSVDSYELEIPLEMFRELSENLGSRLDHYSNWIKWVFVCRTYGLYKLAIELSDVNATKVINPIFQKPLSDQPITYRSLMKWSYEQNRKKHFEIVRRNRQIKMKHSDEYLLRGVPDPVICENSQYISDTAIHKLLNDDSNVYLLHSPTGSGKSTAFQKLIDLALNRWKKSDEDRPMSILSVVSRRGMVATHQEAMPKYEMVSYLDYPECDRFIISLEGLGLVKQEEYEIVILDEIDSVLRHFESSTMEGRRRASLSKLCWLIKWAKVVIAADATLTTVSHLFLSALRPELIYYRNRFMNRLGRQMVVHGGRLSDSERIESIIRAIQRGLKLSDQAVQKLTTALQRLKPTDFKREHRERTIRRIAKQKRLAEYYSETSWIEALEGIADCRWAGWLTDLEKVWLIAERLVSHRQKHRTNLVVSDTLRGVNQLRNALIALGHPKNEILCVTSELGTIEELRRANIVFDQQTVIMSPRVLYGLDLQLNYQTTYGLFRGSSIDSKQMFQQLNRARRTTQIEMIFLENSYRPNYAVDLDWIREQEEQHLAKIDPDDDRLEALIELGSRRSDQGFTVLDLDSLYTQMHLAARYIDGCFTNDRRQLLFALCREQGWEVKRQTITLPEKSDYLSPKIAEYQEHLKDEIGRMVVGSQFQPEPPKKPVEENPPTDRKCQPNIAQVLELEAEPEQTEPVAEKKKRSKPPKDAVRDRISQSLEPVIDRRLATLGRTWDEFREDRRIREIVSSDKRFEAHRDAQLLFMTPDQVKIYRLEVAHQNPRSAQKSNRRLRKLAAIEGLEQAAGIKTRFDFDQLEVDVNRVKPKLLQIVPQLVDLHHGSSADSRLKNRLRKTIEKVEHPDQLKAFIAQMYNRVDRLIKYKCQRIQCRKTKTDRKMWNRFTKEPQNVLHES